MLNHALGQSDLLHAMNCWYGESATKDGLAQRHEMLSVDIVAYLLAFGLLDDAHGRFEGAVLAASLFEKGAVPLQIQLDQVAVASEPFDGDADWLLLGGEALALAGRALVPHQFPMALARVAPRLSIEQRVLLHSQPLARVAGHPFRAAPLPTPITHGADDVPHHEDLLLYAAILDDF